MINPITEFKCHLAFTEESDIFNRNLLGAWMLTAFIVGTVYKSNLMAMLIIPRLNLPFDSLESAVNSNIPLVAGKNTQINDAFKVNIRLIHLATNR